LPPISFTYFEYFLYIDHAASERSMFSTRHANFAIISAYARRRTSISKNGPASLARPRRTAVDLLPRYILAHILSSTLSLALMI
jgi:hypothetical protein